MHAGSVVKRAISHLSAQKKVKEVVVEVVMEAEIVENKFAIVFRITVHAHMAIDADFPMNRVEVAVEGQILEVIRGDLAAREEDLDPGRLDVLVLENKLDVREISLDRETEVPRAKTQVNKVQKNGRQVHKGVLEVQGDQVLGEAVLGGPEKERTID